MKHTVIISIITLIIGGVIGRYKNHILDFLRFDIFIPFIGLIVRIIYFFKNDGRSLRKDTKKSDDYWYEIGKDPTYYSTHTSKQIRQDYDNFMNKKMKKKINNLAHHIIYLNVIWYVFSRCD